MLGITTTDNPYDSPPTDDFAVFAHRFDATTHLHFQHPDLCFVAEHVMIVEQLITLKAQPERSEVITPEPRPALP